MSSSAETIPWVTLKDVCWLAYLHPGLWLARQFPSALQALEGPGAHLARLVARSQQQRVRHGLQTSGHALLRDQAAAIAARYMDHSVARVLDDLCLDRAAEHAAARLTLRGQQHVEAALAAGRGALLVSGHFFASRLAKRVLAKRGYPMLSVRHRLPPDAGMGRYGRRFLQARYMGFLHEVIGDEVFIQDESCSLKILRRLREGGLVNLHMDYPFAVDCVELPFLGRPWRFSTSLIRLSQISGAPVLPFWFAGDRHGLEIEFEPACSFTSDPRRAIEDLVCRLEHKVLQRPDAYEGWLWF